MKYLVDKEPKRKHFKQYFQSVYVITMTYLKRSGMEFLWYHDSALKFQILEHFGL